VGGLVRGSGTTTAPLGRPCLPMDHEEELMGALRKDPTKKKTQGAGRGLTIKGKVRTQDTGRGFGRGTPKAKPMRPAGKGI